MSTRKKVVITVSIILSILLFCLGYHAVKYYIVWNKLFDSPIFHTLSKEEIDYFSEQFDLPLKDGTIISYQYQYYWQDPDIAEIYISIPNDKKEDFLNQVKITYHEQMEPATSNGFYYNGKLPVKWYQRGQLWCYLYEFEEGEKDTAFGMCMQIEGKLLRELTWNKLKAGDK